MDNSKMTVYLAIFKNATFTLELEYIPLEDGAVEIVSAHVLPRPRSPWQDRTATRRRGIVLDETEQRAEDMLPITRLEARQLGMFEG